MSKYRPEKTPYLNTFHAVAVSKSFFFRALTYYIAFYIFSKMYHLKKSSKHDIEFLSNLDKSGNNKQVHQFQYVPVK